ncbi:MAG: hypothetical protein E7F47_08770 [Peptoniphilus harei]|nr:hypothetical protein [Peptoniphilus harei]
MNREYLLIRIACGDTSAEANNVVLTLKDKKAIEWYRAEDEKAEREGRSIVFYAPDEDL